MSITPLRIPSNHGWVLRRPLVLGLLPLGLYCVGDTGQSIPFDVSYNAPDKRALILYCDGRVNGVIHQHRLVLVCFPRVFRFYMEIVGMYCKRLGVACPVFEVRTVGNEVNQSVFIKCKWVLTILVGPLEVSLMELLLQIFLFDIGVIFVAIAFRVFQEYTHTK